MSAAIARQVAVQVIQTAGSTLWQQHLPEGHPFYFEGPAVREEGLGVRGQQGSGDGDEPGARICISPFTQTSLDAQFPTPHSPLPTPQVNWHPRVLWVGIGCERGTSRTVIEQAIKQVLQENSLAEAAIAGIATIDLKADEKGLVELCRERALPLRCFSAEELRSVEVPNPSAVVEAEVGTPSVAEAAAVLGSWEWRGQGSGVRGQGSENLEFRTQNLELNPPSPLPTPDSRLPIPLLIPKRVIRIEGEPSGDDRGCPV